MRRLTCFAFFLTVCMGNAQVIDHSINGFQAGFMGIWLNNESKMAPNWAFRTEIGIEVPLTSGLEVFETLIPVLSIEPRWYYNSPKRQGNSKNTFHNSSNYATVAIRYYPKFLAYDLYKAKFINDADGGLFVLPTWGIRRNSSYRINYELGFGVGIDIYELLTDESSTTDFLLNIHLRIGYKFGRSIFKNSKK